MSGAEVALIVMALAVYRFAVSPIAQRYGSAGQRDQHRSEPVLVLAASTLVICTVLDLTTHVRATPLAQWPYGLIVILLTWRTTTADFDVALPLRPQAIDRAACLACAAAGLCWPPVLLAWLAIGCARLRGWQHHAKMPTRVVKMYVAWFLADGLVRSMSVHTQPAERDGAILFLTCCISLSHYLKPAWSKARLGSGALDWMLNNRTHHLAASAYGWGWARFLPEETVARVLVRLAPFDRAMNTGTMLVEGVCPLIAFLGRWELVAALAATALFNCVIAAASGILFWENIATNAILAAAVAAAPLRVLAGVAGPRVLPAAIGVLMLGVLDLLWQPDHLGWWDTPFTARVHWTLTTRSGEHYGLYNDFMSPYEREYGRTHGTFLCTQPLVHGHLGIVWDRQLRDRIAASAGCPEAIDAIKQDHGTLHWDPAQTADHHGYLTAMFTALNHGVRKSPLPCCLRWAKAPGGQLFYWGDLPQYRGGHDVATVSAWYQERYFHDDTGRFSLIRSDHLFDLAIPPAQGASSAQDLY
ncbi:MAG TPA: hypothetical protein VGS97_23135 [Actinocrinis sp.]|uniref:hypothetical protein n=1 Tax=Actinocrinis sp. TaxID=1920516 RepID=UPI002DDCAB4E|nr:hypothetical protein [Actinocrinis sp.]HEV2347015.1 hypothetical protein [Actinocrinis sp.]